MVASCQSKESGVSHRSSGVPIFALGGGRQHHVHAPALGLTPPRARSKARRPGRHGRMRSVPGPSSPPVLGSLPRPSRVERLAGLLLCLMSCTLSSSRFTIGQKERKKDAQAVLHGGKARDEWLWVLAGLRHAPAPPRRASPKMEGTSHTRHNAERGAQRPQPGVEVGGGGREALRHELLSPKSSPHPLHW